MIDTIGRVIKTGLINMCEKATTSHSIRLLLSSMTSESPRRDPFAYSEYD